MTENIWWDEMTGEECLQNITYFCAFGCVASWVLSNLTSVEMYVCLSLWMGKLLEALPLIQTFQQMV